MLSAAKYLFCESLAWLLKKHHFHLFEGIAACAAVVAPQYKMSVAFNVLYNGNEMSIPVNEGVSFIHSKEHSLVFCSNGIAVPEPHLCVIVLKKVKYSCKYIVKNEVTLPQHFH